MPVTVAKLQEGLNDKPAAAGKTSHPFVHLLHGNGMQEHAIAPIPSLQSDTLLICQREVQGVTALRASAWLHEEASAKGEQSPAEGFGSRIT